MWVNQGGGHQHEQAGTTTLSSLWLRRGPSWLMTDTSASRQSCGLAGRSPACSLIKSELGGEQSRIFRREFSSRVGAHFPGEAPCPSTPV
jgi:hypothetical protein